MNFENFTQEEKKEFTKRTQELLKNVCAILGAWECMGTLGRENNSIETFPVLNLFSKLGFEIFKPSTCRAYEFTMYFKGNKYLLDTLTDTVKKI